MGLADPGCPEFRPEGEHRFLYDVWGESVNLASRMESHGEPDRIHLSEQSRLKLGQCFAVEKRGAIEIKGLGKLETFFLAGAVLPPSKAT